MYIIVGALKRYPWGSTDAIPSLLGKRPDGMPWAEYWLGAHPDGSATVAGGQRLDDMIAQHPESLGEAGRATFGDRLPFLVKLLAAASPLSIQAHPSRSQAEAGHARENEAGIAPSSPERIFRDDWPKPEVIIALDTFDALVGFREPTETARLIGALGVEALAPVVSILAAAEPTADATCEAFLAVFRCATGEMVTALAAALATAVRTTPADEWFRETARVLTDAYLDDPSVLVALMLNRSRLARWDALFVPAGTMHAYLGGVGVEVMAASDNVVRGGLTGKHVDISVLSEIGDFQPGEPTVLAPHEAAPGLFSYETAAPEFCVWLVRSPDGALRLPAEAGPRIVVGLSGELALDGSTQARLAQGDAVFVDAGEPLKASGNGDAVLVSSAHGAAPTVATEGGCAS